MNNPHSKQAIEDAIADLVRIRRIKRLHDPLSHEVRFFTAYSLVRAASSIEYSFKLVVFDNVTINASQAAREFLTKEFMRRSVNPSYDDLIENLGKFNKEWCRKVKGKVDSSGYGAQLIDALKSLARERNSFAHGRAFTCSFRDVWDYFLLSVRFIKYVDEVVG